MRDIASVGKIRVFECYGFDKIRKLRKKRKKNGERIKWRKRMEYTWSSSLIIASHDPLHASAFSCMASFYLVASPLLYFTLIRHMILSFVHLDRRPSDPSGPHPVSVPSSSG